MQCACGRDGGCQKQENHVTRYPVILYRSVHPLHGVEVSSLWIPSLTGLVCHGVRIPCNKKQGWISER